MRVATLEVDFRIPGSHSLKEKRKVVASLKDRIRRRFPVAVAEVGSQEFHARGLLGVAAVMTTSVVVPVVDGLGEFPGSVGCESATGLLEKVAGHGNGVHGFLGHGGGQQTDDLPVGVAAASAVVLLEGSGAV